MNKPKKRSILNENENSKLSKTNLFSPEEPDNEDTQNLKAPNTTNSLSPIQDTLSDHISSLLSLQIPIIKAEIQSEYKTSINDVKDEFTKEINNQSNSFTNEINNKVENSRLSLIETLGIFVGLFTFISIDFQVFKSYRDPYAISGLTLILLGSICFLLSMLHFFISNVNLKEETDESSKEKRDESSKEKRQSPLEVSKIYWYKNSKFILLIICESLFIIFGIALFSISSTEDFEKEALQNSFYKRGDLDDLLKESNINKQIMNCFELKGYFDKNCYELVRSQNN